MDTSQNFSEPDSISLDDAGMTSIIESLSQSFNVLRSTIDMQKQDLNLLQQDNIAIRSTMDKQNQDFNLLREDNVAIRSTVDNLHQDNIAIRSLVVEQNQELERLHQDMNRVHQDNLLLQTTVETLQETARTTEDRQTRVIDCLRTLADSSNDIVPPEPEKIFDLLDIALDFNLLLLISKCLRAIFPLRSVHVCLRSFKMAAIPCLEELKKKAQEFLEEHFTQLTSNVVDLGSLSFEDFRSLLHSDYLNVEKEIEVFHAIIDWVRQDESSRKDKIPVLFDAVRLPLCSARSLKEMKDHLLTSGFQSVQTSIASALSRAGSWTDKRRFENVLFVLGGSDPASETVEALDPSTQQWALQDSIPEAPCGETHAVPLGRSTILVIETDRVRSLDLTTREWEVRASMTSARETFAVTELDGKVYVLGGVKDGKASDLCEVYDPGEDVWTNIAGLTTPRNGPGAASLAGKVFCAGGNGLSSAEMFYPRQPDSWTIIAPMTTKRWGFCMAACSNSVWAFGGMDNIRFSQNGN